MVDILTVGGKDWRINFQATADLEPARHFKLIDQAIFKTLVANNDSYDKNYSPLVSAGTNDSSVRCGCVLPSPTVNQYFAQNIADKNRKPENISIRQ